MKFSKNVTALIAGLSVVGLGTGLSACSAETPAPTTTTTDEAVGPVEPIKVVVNYQAIAGFTVYKLALDEGIFDAHGLDVELFEGGPDATALPLMLNGEVNVVLGGAGTPILARIEGLPVTIVSQVFTDADDPLGPGYGTVAGAATGITSFKELEGKTVGVHTVNCCWAEYTMDSIEAEGGDPSTVNFVQVPFPNQMQALTSGQVDAITTNQPILTAARSAGAAYLGPSMAIALGTDHSIGSVATMSDAFIAENPEVVSRWQAAVAEATEWANTHPDEMRALIVNETGMDPALIEKMPLPRWDSTIDVATFVATTDFMVKHGVISREDVPAPEEILAPGAAG